MSGLGELLWIPGALILAATLVQVLLTTWDGFRRVAAREAQRKGAAELLEHRLAEARRERSTGRAEKPAPSGWRSFRVQRKQMENAAGNICSFYLAPHDAGTVPAFRPGQFLTFRLNIPDQAAPTVRCYSLSDSPRPDHYRITVKRIPPPRDTDAPPGLASNFLHAHIQEGNILEARGPSGNFCLDAAGSGPVVLIAGGVGITPMLSMLNSIVESGDGRETWFFYGVIGKDEHVMKEHLEGVAREHRNVHLQVCYSAPGEDAVLDADYHHAGHVSLDLLRKLLPSSNYDFFVCGPPPMMDSILGGLESWGVPKEHIHFERFGPGAPRKEPPKKAPAAEGIPVKFRRSGRTALWAPGAGTLLDLARANEVSIDSGCERGDCGTCQTAVHEGEVTYLEDPAFEPEGGSCLPCCAVPNGPMELEA